MVVDMPLCPARLHGWLLMIIFNQTICMQFRATWILERYLRSSSEYVVARSYKIVIYMCVKYEIYAQLNNIFNDIFRNSLKERLACALVLFTFIFIREYYFSAPLTQNLRSFYNSVPLDSPVNLFCCSDCFFDFNFCLRNI